MGREWEAAANRALWVFIGTIAWGLVCLTPGSAARAAEPYDYSFSFGSTGTEALGYAAGIAVDSSAGASKHDVYVADFEKRRIEKFSPSGAFILMFGDEVNATTGGDVCTAASGDTCKSGIPASSPEADPAALSRPTFVAVDSSNGPSAGDIYVADQETLRVSKFAPTGTLLAGWGEEGHLNLPRGIGGIAVGPSGNLFVQLGLDGPATISIYGQAGGPISSFPLTEWSSGAGIAVDGSGDIYFRSSGGIEKFEPPGTDLGLLDGETGAKGVAVDPSDGDLFVSHVSGFINEFDSGCVPSACTPVTSFGSGDFVGSFSFSDIAIDNSTHTLFVTVREYGAGMVVVFYPPGVVPVVRTLPSGRTTESTAEVLGSVHSAGAGPVTGCYFEYVKQYTAGGYQSAQSSPCTPSRSYSKAILSGLGPNATYDYRLVAANAHGTSYGKTRTFSTTRALPTAVTGPVVSRGQRSASVSGTVGPGSGTPVIACAMDYASDANYRANGWASAQVLSCGNSKYSKLTPVTFELSGLNPQTTYHYRIVALNSEGQNVGEGHQFETLSVPTVALPEEEPLKARGRAPARRVRCTKRPCDHTFHSSPAPRTWQSPRFPVAYAWQVAIRSHGHWLFHSHLIGGCVAMFRGKRLDARINGCHGHIKLRYVGSKTFTLFWQLYR